MRESLLITRLYSLLLHLSFHNFSGLDFLVGSENLSIRLLIYNECNVQFHLE
jgi:hypothetical protein